MDWRGCCSRKNAQEVSSGQDEGFIAKIDAWLELGKGLVIMANYDPPTAKIVSNKIQGLIIKIVRFIIE